VAHPSRLEVGGVIVGDVPSFLKIPGIMS